MRAALKMKISASGLFTPKKWEKGANSKFIWM